MTNSSFDMIPVEIIENLQAVLENSLRSKRNSLTQLIDEKE